MATWKPNRIKPTTGPKVPSKWKGPKGSPTVKVPAPVAKKPAGKKPKKPGASKGAAVVPKAPKNWYDAANTAARDASIASALANPLKPVTGTDAVAMARALAQSGTAPLLQDYDRQASLAQSRANAQSGRTATGTDQLRSVIAQQLTAQQQSAATARNRIAGAGQELAGTIDQGVAQANQAAAQDAQTRGAGLDGGSAAQRAQEAANARARGQAGTAIALDQQASAAQSGDQLLNQISAATAQQGGERQGAITGSLNTALRDVNEGRSKALASGEDAFMKAIMGLQGQNTQTVLATETLGLNKEKAAADTAIKTAQLEQQATIAKLNAQIKITEGAEQRALRKQLAEATAKQRALDRAARTETADKNRGAANARQDKALSAKDRATRDKAARGKASGAKLGPKDKDRRSFITNVKVAQESGQLSSLKRQARNNPSTYRRLLDEKMGVKDSFSRQLLADMAFGGLKDNTIRAYRARYGRNPPNEWKRYRAPTNSSGRRGAVGDMAGSIADALKSVGG